MSKRLLIGTAAVLATLFAAMVLELALPKRNYFARRSGQPLAVDYAASRDAVRIDERVALRSDTGLDVRFRVLRPAGAAGRLPLLVVIGGHRTGEDVVDLIAAPDNMAYLAIDYPYTGSHELSGMRQWLQALPRIQDALLDTPPALSLALSWALQQEWVDARRVELVGVSLGVPFAAVAGGVDTRFTRLWLLHGGVDNQSWVEYVGREHIENRALRSLAARAALLLVHGNSFDTRHWIDAVAPRPVVFVAACADDYVPRAAVAPLLQAPARAHVELVWTRGRHINPRRPDELQQLLDLVTHRVHGRPGPAAVHCAPQATPGH